MLVDRPLDATISMLQIGMTAASMNLSGTDRYFLDLLRTLPETGVDVRGILLGDLAGVEKPIGGLESFARSDESRFRRWRGIRRSVGRLARHADVIASHGVPHLFPALDLLQSRPLIVHFHGYWAREARIEGRSPAIVMIRDFQERAVFARADRFIVLSQAYASVLTNDFDVSPHAIHVIPGGVDLHVFAAKETQREARAACGLPVDRPIVLCVSRLVAAKGIPALIRAMLEVRRHQPDALLAVVGGGPLAPALKKMVDDLGLGNTVRICGHIGGGLPLFYRAADITVVPSELVEGFGLVALESLAMGTPVLVTPVGGLPEVVSNLDRRLVLEGTAEPHLAAGIVRALGEGRLPDGAACRRYASRFSWPNIARRVADVYRDVLSRQSASDQRSSSTFDGSSSQNVL